MKKIFLLLTISILTLTAFAVHLTALDPGDIRQGENWVKAPNSAWVGKDGRFYKLDMASNTIKWSSDGKKWMSAKDNHWQDLQGHWFKIGENKLWASSDDGKTWIGVPEWKWRGGDGKWYKFDEQWEVWVLK